MKREFFEDALSDIDDKYLNEVINYKKKNNAHLFAFAASFILIVAGVLSVILLKENNDGLPVTSSDGGIIDIGSPTQNGDKIDRPEYIFVNENLYLCVAKSNDNIIDDTFEFVGEITSYVGENEIPTEHLQSSGEWIGCEIYERKTILFVITPKGTYAYQETE